jgi:glycosyltransferase involved in cell wall biosynthesis
VILVDDGSTDGTAEELQSLAAEGREDVTVCFHQANRGKGAALRTGFDAAVGTWVLVQDADLEYSPADYPALLAPLIADEADAVYGCRFVKGGARGSLANYLANRFLTRLANLVMGVRLRDMETCYKAFRRELLDGVELREERFGIEPELTATFARRRARFVETPISYAPRTHAEGKKIGFFDGLSAIRCIFRYGIFARWRRI